MDYYFRSLPCGGQNLGSLLKFGVRLHGNVPHVDHKPFTGTIHIEQMTDVERIKLLCLLQTAFCRLMEAIEVGMKVLTTSLICRSFFRNSIGAPPGSVDQTLHTYLLVIATPNSVQSAYFHLFWPDGLLRPCTGTFENFADTYASRGTHNGKDDQAIYIPVQSVTLIV